MSGSDPVRAGLVRSFARPGGNITGVADLDVELAPKRLEIFRELIPGLKRVLFAYDAGAPFIASQLDGHRAGARLGGARKGEVNVIPSPRFLSLNIPGFIIEAGLRHAIPTMLHASFHV